MTENHGEVISVLEPITKEEYECMSQQVQHMCHEEKKTISLEAKIVKYTLAPTLKFSDSNMEQKVLRNYYDL